MEPAPTQRKSLFQPRPGIGGESVYRHRFVVRLTHWLNAGVFVLLLMSGLQIFNAHPRLYWGQAGANTDRAFISLESRRTADGALQGVTRIGPLSFETTGALGVSKMDARDVVRGFPAWATLPSWQDLAAGRLWHFALAWIFVINGALYLAYGVISGHFWRDLRLTRQEAGWRHLLADVRGHLRFRAPRGEAARRYNPLQKIAYTMTIFIFLPMMVITGLTMSPAINATAPWLLDVLGGRQSARTLHFLSAAATVLFIIVHVVEVFVAGAWNEIRSMITGWYVIRPEKVE